MPDKKLTDNEIIKALDICSKYTGFKDCKKCPLKPNCDTNVLETLALDLINRLQAENERLQNILLSFTSKVTAWSNKKGYDTTELSLIAILDESKNVTANIKAEAYKEFAERLKEKSKKSEIVCNGALVTTSYLISAKNLNNLLKETYTSSVAEATPSPPNKGEG